MFETIEATRKVNLLFTLLTNRIELVASFPLIKIYFDRHTLAVANDYKAYKANKYQEWNYKDAINELTQTIAHIDRLTDFIQSGSPAVPVWKFLKRQKLGLVKCVNMETTITKVRL